MKKTFILLLFVMFKMSTVFSQPKSVGIGTSRPDSSAVLDVKSDTRGLLLPRLSTSAIAAINRPAPGLVGYDEEKGTFMGYGGKPPVLTSYEGSNKSIGSFNYTKPIGQSFSPETNVELLSIPVILQTSDSNVIFTLKLYEGEGFGGPLMDSVRIVSTNTSGSTYDFKFRNSRIYLNAGAAYTFSISTTAGLVVYGTSEGTANAKRGVIHG